MWSFPWTGYFLPLSKFVLAIAINVEQLNRISNSYKLHFNRRWLMRFKMEKVSWFTFCHFSLKTLKLYEVSFQLNCLRTEKKEKVLNFKISFCGAESFSFLYVTIWLLKFPFILYFPTVKPIAVHITTREKFVSAEKRYDVECKSSGSRPEAVLTWWKGSQQIKRMAKNVSICISRRRFTHSVVSSFWCLL